jgi:putative FmdB family regulatory protein
MWAADGLLPGGQQIGRLSTDSRKGKEKSLPIYEYRCTKCSAVSDYFEKFNEWHLFGRKCKKCGSRKTKKIPSTFSSSVARTHTETLNELKHLGNVQFSPRHTPPWGEGPPPGGCPYEKMEQEENKKAEGEKKEGSGST